MVCSMTHRADATHRTASENASFKASTPTARTTRGRQVGHWIGETLLTVLALFGVLCVAAAAAALLLDIRIMVFKTGSMGPDIPAGSVALVRMIPAEEIQVGDIATVYRDDQLPITHRVIGIEPDPSQPSGRIIEMKGDANDSPDIAPYHVEEVGKLFWAQPGLGKVVARLSDPRMMLTIAIVAGLIVGWAFWPRSEDEEAEADKPGRSRSKHRTNR